MGVTLAPGISHRPGSSSENIIQPVVDATGLILRPFSNGQSAPVVQVQNVDGTAVHFGLNPDGEIELSGGVGTNGQVLTSAGAGNPVAWSTPVTPNFSTVPLLAPNSVDRNLIQPTGDADHGLVLKNHSATLTGANPFEHRLSDDTITSRLLPGGNWSCPGAGGANSEQFGLTAAASGAGGSTAFGAGSEASGLNGSTAFGSAATASGQWATAIGAAAVATNDDSIAVGLNSTSAGIYSVALGDDTSATADQATCVGGASRATAVGALALGQNAHATHLGAIAIGAGVSTTVAHEVRFPSGSVYSFFGGAAAAPQTGGAATAGVLYTSAEQAMLQKVYDMGRTFGFLT